MKRLVGMSLFGVLAIAVASPAQDAAVTNPYYPLKAGSIWTYDVQGGPIQVRVTGTEKVKEINGFKLETTAGSKVSATETVGVTKDGVVRLNVNGLTPEAPIMFLPADPEKQTEWNIDTKVAGQDVKGTFKLNKEKVVVNGTNYDTLHVKGADIKIGSTTTTVEYWFAKDVGIVKLKFSLGSQDATLELKEYKPGGK